MIRCSSSRTGKGELLLALNAAEGLLQALVAVRESAEETGGGGRTAFTPLCGQDWDASSRGVELLAPIVRDAFSRLQSGPEALGRVALVRGPGSFTGLRLVLATGAGLARTTGALQAGLDYLPLLAESALLHLGPLLELPANPRREEGAAGFSPLRTSGARSPGRDTVTGRTCFAVARQTQAQNTILRQGCRIWVLTHARRQLVHIQGFLAEPPPPESREATFADGPLPPRARPFSELAVRSPEECADLIRSEGDHGRTGEKEAPGLVLLLGSGLCRNRDFFQRALGKERETGALRFLPPSYNHPSHAALLRAASFAEFARTDVTPLYARPSDAEDNIGRIAGALGLDPAEARQQLVELTGKAGNPFPAEK